MLGITVRFAAAMMLSCAATMTYGATLDLVSTAPSNNAADISRTDAITLTFSSSVSPSSVNSTNIKLQSATGVQPAVLSVSGAVVSVRPKNPLVPWTSYKLNVQSLTGTNGDQLAAPVSLTFKTRDGSWQSPQLLYQLGADQWNAITRSNVKGVRFILWQQTNASGGDDIWALRQLPGKPAETPTLVKSYSYGIYGLDVFIDDDGNAMASWIVQKVTDGRVDGQLLRVSRFLAGTGSWAGWGTPQNIDDIYSEAGENSGAGLKLVFDHAGNALAIWARYQCCGQHSLQTIVANRYTRATGWTKPVVLDDTQSFMGGDMDLQMDEAGNAYAAWFASLGYPYVSPPSVAHYTLNAGWSTPQIIGPYYSHTTPEDLALAVNHRGEAFLMWIDYDGLDYARADSNGNWSAPISIDPGATQAPVSMVLLNDDRAFAVFADGIKQFQPSGNSWSSTHPLFAGQSVPQGSTNDAQIVADVSGNVLVAWTQPSNGINRIFAKRYRANYGWLAPTAIDAGDTLGAGLRQLLMDDNGSAIASWLQNNESGTQNVMGALFE